MIVYLKKMCTLSKKFLSISKLYHKLLPCSSILEKLEAINQERELKKFLQKETLIRSFLHGLSLECEYVIKAYIATYQADHLKKIKPSQISTLRKLLQNLLDLEERFKDKAGIVGYQYEEMRSRLKNKK